MMENDEFILVGAKPSDTNTLNPGGQLSMSIGLCDYMASQGYRVTIIDTLQTSFPIPPFSARLKRGIRRVYQLLQLLHRKKNIKGVIIFSADGASFYERILMAALCRFYRVKSMFFMLSGFFVADMERSRFARMLAVILLKCPYKIGIQGDSWRSFYKGLLVDPTKLVTVRNWLSKSFIASSCAIEHKPDERIRFCFVGWLVKEKGVHELFDAITILAKHYKFEFTFVGSGTLETELHEKIEQHNLSEYVHLTGWVSPDEVKTYLNQSHVFVLPSEAEGFPIALLEAIALGLPAICTNVGAIADSLINDKNGYLLKNGKAESIAEAMACYLTTPGLVSHHSRESINIFAKQHNRDENCKILFEQFISEKDELLLEK
tara:strand:- start:74684 stop:75811 length:1128 start_codon:yes stop_codon:yes gene_type:complete